MGVGWGGSSVVEYLSSMHKPLGLIPDTIRKNKNKNRMVVNIGKNLIYKTRWQWAKYDPWIKWPTLK
jgi:hypothetical protein